MSTQTKARATEKKAVNLSTVKNSEQPEKTKTTANDLLNPTAESRLKRLENFQILATRHQFLNEKNDALQKFIVSSDGTKERFILENAQGFTFEVSNSQVIEKVLYVVKSELQRITDVSEKEVLSFII
ncbi:hypothetical protein JJL45_05170 [Tamlana sp. s12]|uniref:hypothetical protein n=1 Tax=Tamlana sp. s12 TaxID=1630406 RepID=UPI0007FC594C|nr:hypothetical protein [Tamlana sp. s12]OBQ56105.1 hypothetical protein VQ01_06890 [Tamlana sp. s12]QQY83382.1 hypothetical protein JJL45_05170 [Tamlana sp. s12]